MAESMIDPTPTLSERLREACPHGFHVPTPAGHAALEPDPIALAEIGAKMSITSGDHLIDLGYHDITPEQEREIEAREECARRGIDPDEVCADGGVLAWMVVDQETRR